MVRVRFRAAKSPGGFLNEPTEYSKRLAARDLRIISAGNWQYQPLTLAYDHRSPTRANGGLLMFRMEDMNAGPSRRQPTNVRAEPGRELLETNLFDLTKSVRAKNRCNASRLETAGPAFPNFRKLFGPLRYHSPDL